jgi:hypothetical protein
MLSFLASLGIGTIIRQLASAYEAKQKAATDVERIAAEERIKTLEAKLEAKRAVLVAEGGLTRINAYVRAVIGLEVAFLLGKILVWDKALGQWTGGKTDALDPNLWQVVMAVIGFYFLYEAATAVTRIIRK